MVLKLILIYGIVGSGTFDVERTYTADMDPRTPCTRWVEQTHWHVQRHFDDEIHLLDYTCTWEVHL